MKVYVLCLSILYFIGFGIFPNLVSAADSIYFSRANCALPQDILQFGKVRNESITWDPDEFYNRLKVGNRNPLNWRYWGIRTESHHYNKLGSSWVRKHWFHDLEKFGVHSGATHLDITSQSIWGALGKHYYKGPYNYSEKNASYVQIFALSSYRVLPTTTAQDCNLQVSQFFGNL